MAKWTESQLTKLESELELPALTGSEKQVSWARQIRYDLWVFGEENVKTQKQMNGYKNILLDETSATWYIDNREYKVAEMLETFEQKA